MSEKPTPHVGYVFNVCNDIVAAREFYIDLLGMEEQAFMDTPEFGYLALSGTGFQMMWFRAEKEMPVQTEFTCQPGWQGGVVDATSWAVQIPEADFPDCWRRLVAKGVTLFKPVPDWRQDSYWGLSALDPMGVTVEVYTLPAERPEETTWPEDVG